jgi:hypothetical protein
VASGHRAPGEADPISERRLDEVDRLGLRDSSQAVAATQLILQAVDATAGVPTA